MQISADMLLSDKSAFHVVIYSSLNSTSQPPERGRAGKIASLSAIVKCFVSSIRVPHGDE
jgi:hypothetical protein